MVSYKRPGVFVEETLRTRNPDVSPTSSAAVFISAHGRGPADPHLVRSWSDFNRIFGGFRDHTPPSLLPHAVFQFFNNGGREAYVMRVLGANAAVAETSFNDRDDTAPEETLTVESVNEGEWGNDIHIGIEDAGEAHFHLIVYYRGTNASNIVERFTDLSMDPNSGDYVETKVNSPVSGSSYITVHDASSTNVDTIGFEGTRPEPPDEPVQLAGGTNGDAVINDDLTGALDKLETLDRSYLLNFPGVSDAEVVNAAITHVEGSGNGFVIVDPESNLTPDAAVTYAETLQSSSYAAVYYPYLVIADPGANTQGATAVVPPGGAVAGLFSSTDASRGVWKAPAGLETRIAGAVSTEQRLTSDDQETLNSNHVNAIRHAPGAGFVVWGARTLKKTQADKYVPIRRTLIYLKKTLEATTEWSVFEPNDESLWNSLEASVEAFLTGFWQQGGLRGNTPEEAFYVKSDADINTLDAIQSGVVNVEVGVALQYPAEFIVIKLSQWEGGSSVSEA